MTEIRYRDIPLATNYSTAKMVIDSIKEVN